MEFTHDDYTVKVIQLKPEQFAASKFSKPDLNLPNHLQIAGYYIFLEDENPKQIRDIAKFRVAAAAYAARVKKSPRRYEQYLIR